MPMLQYAAAPKSINKKLALAYPNPRAELQIPFKYRKNYRKTIDHISYFGFLNTDWLVIFEKASDIARFTWANRYFPVSQFVL